MDTVVPGGKIVGAVGKGKEAPTLAEQAKEAHLLDLLQGASKICSPFTMQIWFPSEKDENVKNKVVSKRRRGRLNQSQADVVEAMTVGSDQIVVVHGQFPRAIIYSVWGLTMLATQAPLVRARHRRYQQPCKGGLRRERRPGSWRNRTWA
jgi:hypothetical protein